MVTVVDDLTKGTFVWHVFKEVSGNLTPLLFELNFTSRGSKHMEKRSFVFCSICKAALDDPDHQVYWLTNRDKHEQEGYPVTLNVVHTVQKAMIEKGRCGGLGAILRSSKYSSSQKEYFCSFGRRLSAMAL